MGQLCFALKKANKSKKTQLNFIFTFLGTAKHLYRKVCPSVRPSVGPSVRPLRLLIFGGSEHRVASIGSCLETHRFDVEFEYVSHVSWNVGE